MDIGYATRVYKNIDNTGSYKIWARLFKTWLS